MHTELHGAIFTAHWVYCGENCGEEERTTKLSKLDFKRYLKKKGWKFRGRPRVWTCKKCVERIRKETKEAAEKKDGLSG